VQLTIPLPPKMKRTCLNFPLLFSLLISGAAPAAPVPLELKQARDAAAAEHLTAGDLAALGDPFFRFVLKDHADLGRLSEIAALLLPNTSVAQRFQLFVVDEQIADVAQPAARRLVIAYNGFHPSGEKITANVMLSIFLVSSGWKDEPGDIEAWGWDDHRGRYNYYRFDASGTALPRRLWKLRSTSVDGDLKSPAERRDTCLQCHINGAPVMKELFRPWNNWHSLDFSAEYLTPGQAPGKWPVANQLPVRGALGQAENLETGFILDAIRRFNAQRLNNALKRRADTGDRELDPEGLATVMEGPRLLRPVFETTEVNLISAKQRSGMHPLAAEGVFNSAQEIDIPGSFFLNSALIAGGGTADLAGLRIEEATTFSAAVRLTRGEYRQLLQESGTRLLNQSPGDALFAWFVPEASHVDNDLVDQLLRQGIVSPHFLAAALAIDLENPIFSGPRTNLLRFVPEQFAFKPLGAGVKPTEVPRDVSGDRLTGETIKRLGASQPAPGTAEAEFLGLLKSPDAVVELRKRVQAAKENLVSSLSADRKGALKALYARVVTRRQAMLAHPTIKHLDETAGQLLFPKSAP
jgi:hypothetical protein